MTAYTDAIGQAGEDYLRRFKHAHPLPATFRWQELWDAMRAAATEDEWISVTDRMPPAGKFVLVKCPSGYNTTPFVYTTARRGGDFRPGRWIDHANDGLGDWGMEPTHWRALPSDCSTTAAATVAHAEPCAAGKYDEVLKPFLALMERELHANAHKGDRPGWLGMKPDEVLLDIYHHVAKAASAVRDDNVPLICEHAADVANMAMMLVDSLGALIDEPPCGACGCSDCRPQWRPTR